MMEHTRAQVRLALKGWKAATTTAHDSIDCIYHRSTRSSLIYQHFQALTHRHASLSDVVCIYVPGISTSKAIFVIHSERARLCKQTSGKPRKSEIIIVLKDNPTSILYYHYWISIKY